jgi:hypothetical protein
MDENGIHKSNWAFTGVDASPTKSYIVENSEVENLLISQTLHLIVKYLKFLIHHL